MQALVIVDVQNEFSPAGQRAVSNHAEALKAISRRVEHARAEAWPIAWVRHHNKPHESRAFVPGSWGAELSAGFGPQSGFGPEKLFEKIEYGAFTGTGLEEWLREVEAKSLLLVGFYAHMCLSTAAREALVRGFEVSIDPTCTGACALNDEVLGQQTADEVRRSALLHLINMGISLAPTMNSKQGPLRSVPAGSQRANMNKFETAAGDGEVYGIKRRPVEAV